MARGTRFAQLETRSARQKLCVAKKPVFVRIGAKIGLGYRRNRTNGTWVVRVADGRGGNWTRAIGAADDFEDADGNRVLDFWQAQDKARILGRADLGVDAAPMRVAEALDAYEADLRIRGGDRYNVTRVRKHLPPGLANKAVALINVGDLRRWRDALLQNMTPSSANRTAIGLKAALNLAAEHDGRIESRRAWETGLASIPDAAQSRNVIVDEATIRHLISKAHAQGPQFGLLVEVAAVTGARVSQIARLEVQDLQADRDHPRLLMPSSRKGRVMKKISRRPVPIPPGLAGRLNTINVGRAPTAPLLTRQDGETWKTSNQKRSFQRTAQAAGLDPAAVTMYALRHSNIVRQLLAGVPIRVVAVNHDTSVTMIERTYSRYIGDHADQLARVALLDTSAPGHGNVVPMRARP